MSRVVLTCPFFKVEIISNLVADEASLARMREPPADWLMCCPVCGKEHSWLSYRPRLEGAGSQSAGVA